MSEKNNVNVDLGFPTALLLLFVGLKLCRVIAWSWWWVLSPLWITAAIGIVILGVAIYFSMKN